MNHHKEEFRPRRPSQVNKTYNPIKSKKGRDMFNRGNNRFYRNVLLLIFLVFLSFVSYKIYTHFTAEEMIERDFVNHSAYKDVDTRHFEQKNSTHDILIEYPITKYQKINQFVQEKIDSEHAEFLELTKLPPAEKQIYSEKISYQIPRQTNEFISIVISILQDWQGAHPISKKMFWTFDKKTEKTINLSEISNDESARKNILEKIKKDIIEKNKEKDLNLENLLDESLTLDKIENFVAATESSIDFPFGRGVVAPESSGEISSTLNIDSISNELQTDFARRIFSIPQKPKPEEKTATPEPLKPEIKKIARGNCSDCVALTFDDGPGQHTARLLDILQQNNAKATFFMLGPSAQRYPQIVKRISNEGHTAANHSWSHAQFNKFDKSQALDEIVQTNEAIKQSGAIPAPFFRPPYGVYSQPTIEALKEQGMAIAMWNVDPRDWADRNSGLVCQRVVTNASGGSVILLHDIHKTSVDAVPCIIEGLKNRGYRFVNFNEMFPSVSPGSIIYGAN